MGPEADIWGKCAREGDGVKRVTPGVTNMLSPYTFGLYTCHTPSETQSLRAVKGENWGDRRQLCQPCAACPQRVEGGGMRRDVSFAGAGH